MERKLQTVHWEIRDEIGFLKLNQPPENKMNNLFFSELSMLTREVIPARLPAAIIVHGSGRHFSSGADIEGLLSGISAAKNDDSEAQTPIPGFLEENNRSFLFFEELSIPVVAAIQGICLGSALELSLFCHFRLCAENALMALPETSFNLMPGCGGTQHLPKLAGRSRALQLMLEGSTFTAREAVAMGIADRMVPKKELTSLAAGLAAFAAADYKKELKNHYLKMFFSES